VRENKEGKTKIKEIKKDCKVNRKGNANYFGNKILPWN
jgi:hypothetical protein